MMKRKQYLTIQMYTILFASLTGYNINHTLAKNTTGQDSERFLVALLLVDLEPKKAGNFSNQTSKKSNPFINSQNLTKLLASFKLDTKKSKEQLLLAYQKAIQKDNYQLISYQTTYSTHSLDGKISAILAVEPTQNNYLLLPAQENSIKKVCIQQFINLPMQQEESSWLPIDTAFDLMRKPLSKESKKWIKQYIDKRDHKVPQKKITYLLRQAGITSDLFKLFEDSEKIRATNEGIEIKMKNKQVKKSFSFNHNTIIKVPESLHGRLKISGRIFCYNKIANEKTVMYLTGFIVYDTLNDQYKVYRVEATPQRKICYLYIDHKNRWEVVRDIEFSTFMKASQKAQYLLYKRGKNVNIYRQKKKKLKHKNPLHIITKLSGIINIVGLIACFLSWWLRNSKAKPGLDLRPALFNIQGLKNENYTCYLNAAIQLLSCFLPVILKNDILDNKEDVNDRQLKENIYRRIRLKMRPMLKEYINSIISFTRDKQQTSRCSSVQLLKYINLMIRVSKIRSVFSLIPQQIIKAEAKSPQYQEDNKKLIDHYNRSNEKVKNDLIELEKMIDEKKSLKEIAKKILGISKFVNELLEKMEAWKGDNFYFQSTQIPRVTDEFMIGKQQDASEFIIKILDMLRVPRTLLYQTSNRLVYDDINLFDINQANQTPINLKDGYFIEGKIDKTNIFQPQIIKQNLGMKLSELITATLKGDSSSKNNEKDNYQAEKLVDIIEKIKTENTAIGNSMLKAYQEITPQMKEDFLKYQQIKEKRISQKNVDISDEESTSFQKLEENGLFTIFQKMGFNIERVKENIKVSGMDKEGKGIKISKDSDTASLSIKCSLRMQVLSEKLASTGDYVIIAPRIFEFISPTKSKKLPNKIFPDKELTFKNQIGPNAEDIIYERSAVIAHINGQSVSSGHYVSYVKLSGKWHYFNDSRADCLGDGSEEAFDKEVERFSYTTNMQGKKIEKPSDSFYVYLYKKIKQK
ncbi:MAG: hypothetical protein AAF770_00375 [Bacteroidota bacterium]